MDSVNLPESQSIVKPEVKGQDDVQQSLEDKSTAAQTEQVDKQIEEKIQANKLIFDDEIERVRTIATAQDFIQRYTNQRPNTLQKITENMVTISDNLQTNGLDKDQQVQFFEKLGNIVKDSNQIKKSQQDSYLSILPDVIEKIQNQQDIPEEETKQESKQTQKQQGLLTDDQKLQQFKQSLTLSNLPIERQRRLLQKFEQQIEQKNMKQQKFSKSKGLVTTTQEKISQFKPNAKSSFRMRGIKC